MAGRIPKDAKPDGFCWYLTKDIRCGKPTGEPWRLKCHRHNNPAVWDGKVSRAKTEPGE